MKSRDQSFLFSKMNGVQKSFATLPILNKEIDFLGSFSRPALGTWPFEKNSAVFLVSLRALGL
jgi:hypothetical protein